MVSSVKFSRHLAESRSNLKSKAPAVLVIMIMPAMGAEAGRLAPRRALLQALVRAHHVYHLTSHMLTPKKVPLLPPFHG